MNNDNIKSNPLAFLQQIQDIFGDEIIITKTPLQTFKESIEQCTKCSLSESRTHFVFGDGNPDADIMFVGEAPGKDEDLSGIPFVGRAGKLLDKMLEGINLARQDVFIANVLKCRPPQNRDPLPAEIDLCEPYLHKQIDLIKPKVLIALGRIAGKVLIKEEMALKDMKGKTFSYHGVDLVVIYHPAAILRNMGRLKDYEADFQEIAKKYLTNKESG